MKRLSIIGLGALTMLASVSFTQGMPLLSNFTIVAPALAQAQSTVKLALSAEKQVLQQEDGKKTVTWQALASSPSVVPGDIMRYTLNAVNSGDRPVKNLVVTTEKIPRQMVFVKDSAKVNGDAKAEITYSIDNGKTFVSNPTIPVRLANGKIENQPAPATVYTHVRWKFTSLIPAKGSVSGNYQLRVR